MLDIFFCFLSLPSTWARTSFWNFLFTSSWAFIAFFFSFERLLMPEILDRPDSFEDEMDSSSSKSEWFDGCSCYLSHGDWPENEDLWATTSIPTSVSPSPGSWILTFLGLLVFVLSDILSYLLDRLSPEGGETFLFVTVTEFLSEISEIKLWSTYLRIVACKLFRCGWNLIMTCCGEQQVILTCHGKCHPFPLARTGLEPQAGPLLPRRLRRAQLLIIILLSYSQFIMRIDLVSWHQYLSARYFA